VEDHRTIGKGIYRFEIEGILATQLERSTEAKIGGVNWMRDLSSHRHLASDSGPVQTEI
jgi:hypothetical protein